MKAFIKTDELESKEVVNSLENRLSDIQIIKTDKDWRDIKSLETAPFLYFRNPYIRINNEKDILSFHIKNSSFPFITSKDGELISVSPQSNIKDNHFIINSESSYYRPSQDPLPIILGTNRRPIYLELTLNSLLYNIKDPRQKIYIVVSDPDKVTLEIISSLLKKEQSIDAVLVQENLKYSFANFCSKFFSTPRFIHFEDDGLLPENTHYNLPFWPSQLTYRLNTANLVAFKIQEYFSTNLLKSSYIYRSNGALKISENTMWHYVKYSKDQIFPIGGLGMVIDAEKSYINFREPGYFNRDDGMARDAGNLCLANIPIYHIGNNQKMDYPDYVSNKKDLSVSRFQIGENLRTHEKKIIDLRSDWIDYKK